VDNIKYDKSLWYMYTLLTLILFIIQMTFMD